MKAFLRSVCFSLVILPIGASMAAPAVPTMPATPPAMPAASPALPATPAMPAKSMVDINSADATMLESLPGVGPTKAQAIVDYRTKNGPFQSAADLEKVPGIGPKTMEQLTPLITAKPPMPAVPTTPAGVKK